MRNFKVIIKCIIFLLICVVLNFGIKFALMPSSYTRVILHELEKEGTNYNTIILGASHGRCAYNPYIIDEKLNTSSINLSIPGETMQDSYFLLKESVTYNNVKRVILDIDHQYWYNPSKGDFGEPFICDNLNSPLLKLQYIKENLLQKDFRVTLSRWSNYTYLLGNVKYNLSKKLTKDYFDYNFSTVNVTDVGGDYAGKGFFKRKTLGHDIKVELRRYEWDSNEVDQKSIKYFQKIVNYCKENNIELTCITSPITPSTLLAGPYLEISQYFKNLCEKYNIQYYDFNLVKESYLEKDNDDYTDYDGHMAGDLPNRYSELVSTIILNQEKGNSNNHVFYSSFSDYLDNLNKVDLVQANYDIQKISDNEYNVNIEILGGGGTRIIPEYKIILKDNNNPEDVNIIEYNESINYSFKLKPGSYSLKVLGRSKGRDVEYEEYCIKNIEVNEKTFNDCVRYKVFMEQKKIQKIQKSTTNN